MSSRKVYIEGLQSASQGSGWQARMSSESQRQMPNSSAPSIQHVQQEDNQGSIQPNVARQNVSFVLFARIQKIIVLLKFNKAVKLLDLTDLELLLFGSIVRIVRLLN